MMGLEKPKLHRNVKSLASVVAKIFLKNSQNFGELP